MEREREVPNDVRARASSSIVWKLLCSFMMGVFSGWLDFYCAVLPGAGSFSEEGGVCVGK